MASRYSTPEVLPLQPKDSFIHDIRRSYKCSFKVAINVHTDQAEINVHNDQAEINVHNDQVEINVHNDQVEINVHNDQVEINVHNDQAKTDRLCIWCCMILIHAVCIVNLTLSQTSPGFYMSTVQVL